jgi:hypothetical protein
MIKKLISFVLPVLLLTATGAARAQSTTEGAIAGTVEDSTSAAVPNAAITIRNDGTNAEKHLVSDGSGYFIAPLLEPGTYTVTIDAAGFGKETEDHVTVQVGQLTTIRPLLKTGAETTTVNVSADAAVLNFESPDMTSVLTSTALTEIPVQNRRWSSLALTTPGVVADSSGFGLISVRGMSTLLNNIEIDGADDNQAYFSEERGRTREGYSTSANAVREFEVNTGVYSAQYGRAAGGVINSVTKSGTNQIHGDVIFNDLDKGFGAYTPGSISPTGAPLKPKDLRKIYGFSVGGPILKDKLFFFYTYDQLTHINPAISKANQYNAVGTTPGFLTQPDPTVTTCTVNTTTGAVTVTGATATASGALDTQVCALQYRLGLASYAAAANYYNAGVTALTTDLGIVPRAGYQEINTPKLDWQISSKERASFLFHRLRWDAPGDVQTTSSASYSLDAFGNDFVKLDYGVAKLESQLTSRISNEVLYQYSRELNDESQQPYSAYTTNNLVAPGGGAILGGLSNAPGGATIPYIALDTSIGFNMGSPYYSYRIAYPDERKWQAEDILYYQLGNHSLRMGMDFVHNYDILRQTPYYFGDYSYSNLANYLTDLATKGKSQGACNSAGSGVGFVAGSGVVPAVGGYECYSSAFQDFGATKFNIATQDYAGFVQDNWKTSSRLTLELGLRYDIEVLPPINPGYSTAVGTFVPYAGITNVPSDKNNFGPRLGFAYDVYGTGNTVLRGGYGLYYGRILNGTVATVQFGTGSPVGQYGLASTKPSAGCTTSAAGVTSGCSAPIFPNPFAAGAGSKPSSFFLAPNLQNPAVHEFNLQLQQQVGQGTVLQFSYLGAMGRTLPNFLNVNLAPPEVTSYVQINGGPATGQLNAVPTFGTCTASATCPYPTGYINSNFTNITEVISNINSSYNGFVVEIQNRSFHGLQFDGNYTWSHSLDFNQNASSTTSTNNWLNPYAAARQNYGTSQFNVGNRFVGYALYNFPNFVKSGALKYVADGWTFNDTFQMQNGLPYSAIIGSGFNSAAALNSSYNGVNSVYYIPTIGINTYQAPRAIVDDMRLQKGFRFGDRYDLQLAADVYNIANHENFNVGNVNNTAYNFGTSSGTIGTTAANPVQLNYQATFGTKSGANNSGFLYTPREIQLGARLEF